MDHRFTLAERVALALWVYADTPVGRLFTESELVDEHTLEFTLSVFKDKVRVYLRIDVHPYDIQYGNVAVRISPEVDAAVERFIEKYNTMKHAIERFERFVVHEFDPWGAFQHVAANTSRRAFYRYFAGHEKLIRRYDAFHA
jgi:hypothetical protein